MVPFSTFRPLRYHSLLSLSFLPPQMIREHSSWWSSLFLLGRFSTNSPKWPWWISFSMAIFKWWQSSVVCPLSLWNLHIYPTIEVWLFLSWGAEVLPGPLLRLPLVFLQGRPSVGVKLVQSRAASSFWWCYCRLSRLSSRRLDSHWSSSRFLFMEDVVLRVSSILVYFSALSNN